MATDGPVKRFFQGPVGRVVLIVMATLLVAAGFLELGALIAIAAALIFALAVPIWLGIKRPRLLAVIGLLVIVLAPAVAGPVYAYEARLPTPAAASSSDAPWGNGGGSVLDQGVVTPFAGAAGGVYHYSLDLRPQFLPSNTSGVLWVELYVTTCPEATTNTSSFCSPGFTFYNLNRSFVQNVTGNATNTTNGTYRGTFTPQTVTFNVTLPGANIWWWQAAAVFLNASHGYVWAFLVSNSGYTDIQGPVSGDYVSTLEIALPAIYFSLALDVGVVYFFALLVYAFFKGREERRKGAAGMGLPPTGAPMPPGGETSARPPPPGGATAPPPNELSCPNCRAVVYPKETTCWKCGATLPGASGSAPLPSSGR